MKITNINMSESKKDVRRDDRKDNVPIGYDGVIVNGIFSLTLNSNSKWIKKLFKAKARQA